MKPRVTDLDRQAARLLIETFRPRLDVYAERLDDAEQVDSINKWMADKGAASASARPPFRLGDWKPCGAKGARRPVTVNDVAEHVAGRRTLGFYPLHPDGVCNSVSVDFDNHRGSRVTERDPREDYDAVSSLLMRRGVRFIGHHSRGGRGYWIHLLPPVGTQASVARAVLQRLLDEAGVKHIDGGGTVDSLFPKQDRAFAGTNGDTTASPGNLFCLPLSRRWLASDPPGSHLVGHDPRDLESQVAALGSYL